MILEAYDHMVSQAASALAVQVVQAFPNWSRPALAPPLAAVEISDLNPAGSRIGQADARHVLVLRLYVFANTETQLGQMLDGVVSLKKTLASLVVGGAVARFSISGGQRYQSLTGAVQEDHAFFFSVSVNYTE